MNTRLKKLLPVAVAGLLSPLMLQAAAYNDSCAPCPPPKAKPCPPPPVCEPCDEVLARNLVFDDCNCRITPDAGPRVACGVDLFVTADYILWNSRMEGLGFAATGAGGITASTPPASKGSVSHPDFGWESGFKVGLGYSLAHDGWDVFAEYTWLRPSATESKSSGDGVNANLTSLWPVNSTVNTAMSKVRADWDYDLNVLDVEQGRNFFISRFLTLRPHWGIKGVWNEMDYNVKGDVAQGDLDGNFAVQHRVDYNQDYWAVGLRTGLDTVWYFNRYFGVYGDFAISAIWGKSDVDYKTTIVTTANEGDTPVSVIQNNLNNEFYGLKSVMEWTLGLQGDVWFSDDAFHLGINIGWEMQYWPNQNQLFRFFEESNHGDLMFMGLTAGLRFDF